MQVYIQQYIYAVDYTVHSINSMQFDKRKNLEKNSGKYKYSFVHKRSNTPVVILWILHVFIYVHDMTAVV